MNIIGIICEYNPFHNGHIYHLNKIKEMYPNSLIILVLNGYFLERGEASLLTKEEKVKLSLLYNIDIVLELPVFFGTQSADTFASISLKILNYFKVEYIIFGSELNDIKTLEKIVSNINSKEYQQKVKDNLKKGMNYPTALAKSIDINADFNNPNDLLAITYIKAIKENNYKITPISIKRTSAYHDIESNEFIISAKNIRNKFKNNLDISNYTPKEVSNYLKVFNEELFFKLLKTKILTTPNLSQFLTVSEGIENRLVSSIKKANNMEEFIKNVKTKRYTYNKINRMCVHILLGITKEEKELAYVKVLGFNKKGLKYLHDIKKDLDISLNPIKDSLQYKTEITASLIYDILFDTNTYYFEISNKPIIK